MVDPRIYRAALAFVLIAVIVFGFSLEGAPPPAGTAIAPGPFFSTAASTMKQLARSYPNRPPGSVADDELAAKVAGELKAIGGFTVSTTAAPANTANGTQSIQTVTATRSALGTGAIVVVADRDASGSPATSELSGTAVLLGLARALGGASLNRPVMLVSSSGSVGEAGTAQLAAALGDQPVDAVITLGDLAGAKLDRPIVTPWSTSDELAPMVLRRTLNTFLSSQAGISPSTPGVASQLVHLAFPFTTGQQAPLLRAGIPAVGLSTAGDRLPAANEALSAGRIAGIGAAVLQTIDALEAAPPVAAPSPYLTINGQVVPLWAVRLLVLALILPVAATTVDALARARRRGHNVLSWLGWVLVGAVPFLVGAAAAMLAGLAGALPAAPPGPVAGGVPIDTAGTAVLALVLILMLAGSYFLRPWLLRMLGAVGGGVKRQPETPVIDGAAVALSIISCLLALLLWAVNPFAALLLVPALHAWLWLADEAVRERRLVVLVLALVGIVPAGLVLAYYMHGLGLSPLGAAWSGLLWVAGRGLSPLATVFWSLALGTFVSALVLAVRTLRTAPAPAPVVTVRGPATYAGPGSLGGTESALRR